MLDICLCTYNPRLPILERVIDSVARQECDSTAVRFFLIDNASKVAVSPALLDRLKGAGIPASLLHETQSGIFHARNCAMRNTQADLVLWIDDDTELPSDYVAKCLSIAEAHPQIGCFGGRLLAGSSCKYPAWCVPFLPYLAIIDRGKEPITGIADHWGPWEPPTAGAVVRRSVISKYLEFVGNLPATISIGQVGTAQLLRGEDSLLMRMALHVGLQCSYQPSLYLWHHVDNRRFRVGYLLRLFYGYGRSYVILERLLGKRIAPMNRRDAWHFLWTTRVRKDFDSNAMFVAMKVWNLGFIAESGRERRAS